MTAEEEKILKAIHFWALPRTPGSRLIQNENWLQVISEDNKTSAHNEVVYSYQDDPEFENRLDETITFYRGLGTDFKWCTNPFTRPTNARELLKSRGFTNWETTHMYLRVSDSQIARPHDEVRRIGHEEMEVFLDLFIRCWNVEPVRIFQKRAQLLFDNGQTEAIYERYVVFVDGKPAGVGSLAMNPNAGYLHSTAVLPEFQGRGAYRKLVEARLHRLKNLNIKLAATVALPTSAPRLKHFGFETAWNAEVFLKTFQ